MRFDRLVRLSIAHTVVLASVLASPVYAQFGRNKIQYKDHHWEVLSTPHFEIHFYEGSEAFAVRAGLLMEDGYEMLAEKLQITLPWKVPVILYSSHNDFLQTNVSLEMLTEGVQAFAEPSRKRIVLPFTGSWPAFSHTAIHELAHVFSFQIVYNRLMDNVFSRNGLFGIPLWLMEGLAEYLSVGWDTETDMFIRDGVIHDYLGNLNFAQGYTVYKQGQSAFNYIEETYGKEKVLDVLDALAITRSAEGALEKTLGLTTTEFSNKWKMAQRKRYWPMIAERPEITEISRRLTNHISERAVYNTKPVFSPDGEKIAFFSSRDGLISVYLISALDGKVIDKLISGYRSDEFESLHFYTSSLSFSPDGRQLSLAAKSGGKSLLYIFDIEKKEIVRKLDLEANGLASPAWSPKGDVIVVSAIFSGQTDLMMVNLETGAFERLTDDFEDQLTPRFFPDGRRIVFCYYPNPVRAEVPRRLDAEGRRTLNEMDFLAPDKIATDASMDIYEMDLETRVVRPLVQTAGDDNSPVVFDDGRKMIFASDASGTSNLYIADLESGTYHRFTDALGGIFTPDVSEAKGRLAFSSFEKAGWDVCVSDDLEELIENRYDGVDRPSVAGAGRLPEGDGGIGPDIPVASLLPRDTGLWREPQAESRDANVFSLADEDSLVDVAVRARIPSVVADPNVVPSPKADGPPQPRIEGVNTPVGKDEPATRGGTVSRYKLKLAPDFVGQAGGLYFSTGFGFGLANTIALSDLLGNHRMVFSFNIFRDIVESDLLFQYFYLKKRINYGVGVFQFNYFLNSRVTSIGESFRDYTLFSERNYGMFGLVSYPLSTFDRLDLELQAFISEREFFEETRVDPYSYPTYQGQGKSTRNLIEPGLSFVHDAALWGYYGPVDGSRYMLSVLQGFGVGRQGVTRFTTYVDYRKYFKLWYRNSFAFRLLSAMSEGPDRRVFFLGGPTTLRGYDYQAFEGSRMVLMNFEYRFPMIDALIFGFPGPWGIGNLGGTAFFDLGAAWDKGRINWLAENVNGIRFDELRGDIGIGTHFYLGYFLLQFQVAWPTDLHSVGRSQFHFFIGPSF